MDFTGLKTSPTMIITNCNAKSDVEVISLLSDLAQEQNYVNEQFKEKILEREKDYPTGLPTEIPIAIPHVHDGCLKSFFSVAVLNEPVGFASMDGSEEQIMAKIIFLFGITDPSHQTAVLRKFCTIFQDVNRLGEYIACRERDLLLNQLKEDLGDYIIL